MRGVVGVSDVEQLRVQIDELIGHGLGMVGVPGITRAGRTGLAERTGLGGCRQPVQRLRAPASESSWRPVRRLPSAR
jgi:hypothetical protein